MADVVSYKCPNCGGALAFDPKLQKLKCPFCDSDFFPEELKQNMETEDAQLQLDSEVWQADETANMRVYECQSCGAEIVAEPTAAASKCPYCDNNVIMKGQFAGDLRPDLIIPFKETKKQAVEKFRKHIKSRKYVPKVFGAKGHPDEIKGVYVPFWLFSSSADVDFTFTGYKISHYQDSSYRYTETETYDCRRAGTISLKYVPVDGSSKLADELMETIEPFQVAKAKPFNMSYLSGFLADRYDVGYEACRKRAEERMTVTAEEEFRRSVREYDSLTVSKRKVDWGGMNISYGLFPVWLLSTIYHGKSYQFAMNGQNGKFAGDLPVDRGAFFRSRLVIFIITALIVTALIVLVMMFV